jgi:hypothetical protein
MLTILTAAAFFLLARELCVRIWPDDLGPLERACFTSTIAMSAWLASLWLLGLPEVMTRATLLARTIVVAAVAVFLAFRRGREQALRRVLGDRLVQVVIALSFLPLVAWLVFILWRGFVLPPLSHDVLSYHLPKAVFFVRAHGYEYLSFLDARIRNIPANYEMLLADMLALDGSDTITEWVSTLFYVLFALSGGALVERWWRSTIGGLATLAFIASIPVAVLHSGAHKNDLMTGFFIVAAIVAGGRWIASLDARALLLAIIALLAGIGTKPHAAAVAVCLAPFVLWPFIRRRAPLKTFLLASLLSVAAFFALGGGVYVLNAIHGGEVVGAGIRTAGQKLDNVIGYGDWNNLWQGPFVLITGPFSPWEDDLWVPWESDSWFWKKHEIFFSHLGVPFAICVLLLPFAIGWFRRDPGSGAERMAGSLAVLGAFILMLPVNFTPHGMYTISLPRYAIFLAPVVFGWTLGPATARLARKDMRLSIVVFALAAAWMTDYAIDNAMNDRFAPLSFAVWASHHPGTRVIPFSPNRAASMVDRLAGPYDKIAIDAGFGTWIYPAFGAGLTRPVIIIPPASGPPRIADDVRWVVIDRGWRVWWDMDSYRDLSQWRKYLGKGHPAEDDLRVLHAMVADPRFGLVFLNQRANQAVFRRR